MSKVIIKRSQNSYEQFLELPEEVVGEISCKKEYAKIIAEAINDKHTKLYAIIRNED